MSGFVGIFHRDGRPVDAALLETLTDSMRFRGPDGTQAWRRGPVGLGHARFVTHPARDGEAQPLSLDSRYWITGHIRLDARDELIAAVSPFAPSSAQRISRGESDAALVLRAYRAWGTDCVQHIQGDFSFAIWDSQEQRLFCARDRFGVRPFFYAELGDLFLCSNTLNTLRQHECVGTRLNELALADFLVCGYPLDADTSFFSDVRRLPAGHCMTVSAVAARIQRYWSLPEESALRYRRADQYVEHFADVLSRAVADRTGSNPVGISLSGGLDSGAIAAAVVGRLGRPPAGAPPVLAFCSGWNCAFDDPEPQAAGRTAAALGIPLEILEARDCVPFAPSGCAWIEPEPSGDYYFHSQFIASLARMSSATRINLDGQGGDEIFAGETLRDEAAREPLASLTLDTLRTWAAVRRPAFGLRPRPRAAQGVPAYLDAEWHQRLGLARRISAVVPPGPAGRRPIARARLGRRIWGPYLESFDVGFTGVAIETRWPYLDERVVRFALSLPPLPWCIDKHLLRRVLRPLLPGAITRRPKSALAGDPLGSFLRQQPRWPHDAPPGPGLAGRVDSAAWHQAWRAPRGTGDPWQLARPLALADWLRRSGARLDALPAPATGAVKSRHTRSPQHRTGLR